MGRHLRWITVVSSLVLALLLGETASRALDGYAVWSIRLTRTRAAPTGVPDEVNALASRYARAVPLGPRVDGAWYDQDPPPIAPYATPEWASARVATDTNIHPALFEFNRAFLADRLCRGVPTSTFGTLDSFLYFDPIENGIYPSYRHSRRLSAPGWFTTNSFGWRGPDLELNKPAATIRIAFVGASTTVNEYVFPYSYPELIGHWLNLWSEARGWPYRFEVINSGRTGIDSHSIAAIVRQELVPVEPDLVVYYEGSNQFWPPGAIGYRFGRLYPRPNGASGRVSAIDQMSALAVRARLAIESLRGGDGSEPLKPFQWLRLAGVDEQRPDPYDGRLPVELPAIVADLDAIRASLETIQSELVMTSFIWMVKDGLKLDLPRQLGLFNYLNRDYWPATYATMRRLADLQNRVFAAYARQHQLPFLDVAAAFTLDANLFGDAIHLRYPAVRLHAWLVFQGLTPLIEQRIAAGRLPRPASRQRSTHPAFDQPSPRTITRSAILALCSSSAVAVP